MIELLVIAGPAGVGKTAAANEVSHLLRLGDVAHAVIDTDALDDIYPVPADQWRLSERNLSLVWQGFMERGAHRLILNGVYLHRDEQLEWISRATDPERVTLVRLTASDATLAERVGRREIGSVRDDQLARTLRQARELDAGQPSDAHVIETDGKSVVWVAQRIVEMLGWSEA